ncbi:MAG: hypothetical protein KC636_39545, partial [Myxococcales bacterium]|nr:hypothetical protein [Myxococcales bacterium]
MRRLAIAALLLSSSPAAISCSHAGTPGARAPQAPVLPLAKVRLYESGVGYFERAGELQGGGAALPVPAAHLDDAIKSLVVLSKDGSIEDISFDSRLSPAVARARAGLPPDSEEDIDLGALLETLKGARVELRIADERLRGRLVDVVEVAPDEVGYLPVAPPAKKNSDKDKDSDAEAPKLGPQLHVTLLTVDGQFRRIEASQIAALRPLDEDRRRRFEAALAAQETAGSQSATTMTLDASTHGPVRLGYLAEAPIWRTTFRLVFTAEAATLQGWALVHNDTDEGWEGVTLELVNGRPDSFLFPLAAPRYERRDLETPPSELSSIPQLLVTTPDALWGDFADTWGGLSGSGSGYGSGGGAGFGGRGKRVPKMRQAQAQVTEGSSDLLNLGDLAAIAGATGEETETVFVYQARRPLRLGAHRSALVPFLHEAIEAAPIVRFGAFNAEARHAIRVVNNTHKTLPPGPMSIFGDGGFMGEATLSRLKPGERQYAEIGDDPDTELDTLDFKQRDRKEMVVFRGDALETHYIRTETRQLQFNNRSGREREVHLVLSVGRNAAVDGADGIDFDSAEGTPLVIFKVPPGKSKPRTLTVKRALRTRVQLDAVNEALLRELSDVDTLPAREREILQRTAAQAHKVEVAQAAASDVTAEIGTVGEDLERLREHLKALGDGEKGASKPLLARLLATEDRLQQLRQTQATATKAVARERDLLRDEL